MTAAQFASFAGGAISAAVFVFEGYQIKKGMETLESTCPKADLLRKILQELDYDVIPDTSLLEYECNNYIEDVRKQIGNGFVSLSNDDIHDILTNIILMKNNSGNHEIDNDGEALNGKDMDDDNSTITTKTTTLSDDNSNDDGNTNDTNNKNTKSRSNIMRSWFSFHRRKTTDHITM